MITQCYRYTMPRVHLHFKFTPSRGCFYVASWGIRGCVQWQRRWCFVQILFIMLMMLWTLAANGSRVPFSKRIALFQMRSSSPGMSCSHCLLGVAMASDWVMEIYEGQPLWHHWVIESVFRSSPWVGLDWGRVQLRPHPCLAPLPDLPAALIPLFLRAHPATNHVHKNLYLRNCFRDSYLRQSHYYYFPQSLLRGQFESEWFLDSALTV